MDASRSFCSIPLHKSLSDLSSKPKGVLAHTSQSFALIITIDFNEENSDCSIFKRLERWPPTRSTGCARTDPGLGWSQGRRAPRCSWREGIFHSVLSFFWLTPVEQTCPSPGKSPSLCRGHIAADRWGSFLENKWHFHLEDCSSPKSRVFLWDPHNK